jgi:DNA helicase-2/ATP-dependent DNA helicase PcrA
MTRVDTAAERCAKKALISDEPLVVIEAPAGCGKTHIASNYAAWLVSTKTRKNVLILTHTHAACDVFRMRTRGVSSSVTISTFDGFITQICTAYHQSLTLPKDVSKWARDTVGGFEELGRAALRLLHTSPGLLQAISFRYPFILCDEHQDSNPYQNGIVLALQSAGSMLRIFGDPMQEIYGKGKIQRTERKNQWGALLASTGASEKLDYPHRWDKGCRELGAWILEARELLSRGQPIDLSRKRPRGLKIVIAENISPKSRGFLLAKSSGRSFREVVKNKDPLMVLASQNELVNGVNAFLGRSIPIWEGHQREALSLLVRRCAEGSGDAASIADAFRLFVQAIGTGFSDSAFAKRLLQEVGEEVMKPSRGKILLIQRIANHIRTTPTHVGIAAALAEFEELRKNNAEFKGVYINHRREFWEAVKLGKFPDPELGFAEITSQRNFGNKSMPNKVISTIHKAKGLESDHVVVTALDSGNFPDTEEKRCLLYVAISRAKQSVTIIASKNAPSPLLRGL